MYHKISSTTMYSGESEKETYSFSTRHSASSSYQDNIRKTAVTLLDELYHRKDSEQPLVVADYGTADGVNFLSMMNSLLEKELRKLRDRDILFYLNDQPSNDFNLLMTGITERRQISSGVSRFYVDATAKVICGREKLRKKEKPGNEKGKEKNELRRFIDVVSHGYSKGLRNENDRGFLTMKGLVPITSKPENLFLKTYLWRSSAEACTSDVYQRTVWMFVLVQQQYFGFLASRPCNIKNGLTHFHADEIEKRAFEDQARDDWRNFVINRGKELKKDGYSVVLCPIFPDEDADTNENKFLTYAWQKLLNDECITQDEFINATVAMYISRTTLDFSYPFDNKDEEIINLGLQLVSIKLIKHEFTEMIKHNSEKDTKHREKYADMVVGLIKPWLRNTIYCGLSSERSESSRIEICDKFFQELWGMAFRKEIILNRFPFQEVVMKKC